MDGVGAVIAEPACPIERAQPRDGDAIRELLTRQVSDGSARYDAWMPHHSVMLDVLGFEQPEIWIVRQQGQVVAVGWYDFVTAGEIRVVVVTDTSSTHHIDPLLDRLEQSMHALIQRHRITAVHAWLPAPLLATLQPVYVRHGWRPHTQWYAPLTDTRPMGDTLRGVLATAREAGITVRAAEAAQARVWPAPQTRDRGPRWEAYVNGRVVATNGIDIHAEQGRVVWVDPRWRVTGERPALVTAALLAQIVLDGTVNLLVSRSSVAPYASWVTPAFTPLSVHGCSWAVTGRNGMLPSPALVGGG